jgi:oligopeptide/dipeptide ABC transporter ATP-binding protein
MITAGENLLSVRDLVVRYHARGVSGLPLTAVRGVSLDIPPASIFGLVGESGSGKSSLALAILQLLPSSSGQVLFRGQDLAAMKKSRLVQVRRNMQAVFQDSLASLSPRRSVLQILLEPLNHVRIGNASRRQAKAESVLETVGLDPSLGRRYPRELSGGQRQRVSIARALVTEPELIIADEPLSSLDVPVQSRIIDLILDLRKNLGISFLFVSHDLSLVRRIADTVSVMYLGKFVESGPAEAVFGNPAHPYTRSLLHAVPVPDPAHAKPVVLPGEHPSPLTPPAGCVFHRRCPELIAPCSSAEPGESRIDGESGQAPGDRESAKTGHRVRCHLWKSSET